jgi:hypothetical protein
MPPVKIREMMKKSEREEEHLSTTKKSKTVIPS